MALERISVTPVPKPPVQIAFYDTSPTNGQVIYVVPPGRKFEGSFVGPATNNYAFIRINGTRVASMFNAFLPLSLLEGTVVSVDASSTTPRQIVGVESNA